MAENSKNMGAVTFSIEVDMIASEQFDRVANMLGYVKEKTCTIVDYSKDGEHAEDIIYYLSCGHWEMGREPNYCPGCGAKVVN